MSPLSVSIARSGRRVNFVLSYELVAISMTGENHLDGQAFGLAAGSLSGILLLSLKAHRSLLTAFLKEPLCQTYSPTSYPKRFARSDISSGSPPISRPARLPARRP